jgi:hypothetical protein
MIHKIAHMVGVIVITIAVLLYVQLIHGIVMVIILLLCVRPDVVLVHMRIIILELEYVWKYVREIILILVSLKLTALIVLVIITRKGVY